MAKRKYWEELSDKEDFFVQMPYSILRNTISNNAKVLFLHLWEDAFTNNKKHKGRHYSDLTLKQMAEKLDYSTKGGGLRAAKKAINELNQRCIIESEKYVGNRYWHCFLAKHNWEV